MLTGPELILIAPKPKTHSELARRSWQPAPSASAEQEQQLASRHFAEILSVCHTVVVESGGGSAQEGEEEGARTYQVRLCDDGVHVHAQ